MPTHDIIDNREGVLLDHVKGLLRVSESAKFAVGSFFRADEHRFLKRLQRRVKRSSIFTHMKLMRASSRSDLRFDRTRVVTILKTIHTIEPI